MEEDGDVLLLGMGISQSLFLEHFDAVGEFERLVDLVDQPQIVVLRQVGHKFFLRVLPRLDQPVSLHVRHVVQLEVRLQVHVVVSLVVPLDALDVLQFDFGTVVILQVYFILQLVDRLNLLRDDAVLLVDRLLVDNRRREHQLVARLDQVLQLALMRQWRNKFAAIRRALAWRLVLESRDVALILVNLRACVLALQYLALLLIFLFLHPGLLVPAHGSVLCSLEHVE